MTLSHMRSAVVLALACGSLAAAQGQQSRAYVQASRATVRAQPSATARVVGYLPTNTSVEILDRTGEWCRVQVTAVAAPAFMACTLLGETALTMDVVESRLQDSRLSPRERLDWVLPRVLDLALARPLRKHG